MDDVNPDESLDAEGIPGDLMDSPPGIDVETDSEGMMAPRDHSIAAGSDPAYPNTAAEAGRPESVALRAAREEPEVGAGLYRRFKRHRSSVATGEGGYLGPDPDDAMDEGSEEEIADLAEGEGRRALGPEDAAMHVVSEEMADDLDPAIERAQYLEP